LSWSSTRTCAAEFRRQLGDAPSVEEVRDMRGEMGRRCAEMGRQLR
jgi:hypothetical protein